MGKLVEGFAEKVAGRLIKNVASEFGNVLSGIGLESVGDEIGRWGEDFQQVLKVYSGQYHRDQKKIAEKQKQLEGYQNKFNGSMRLLSEKMDSLIAFDEIFKMSMGNKMDALSAEYGPQMEKLMEEYKALTAKLKSDYDFVIGLTEGPFLQKIIGGIIMIHGGLMSDLGDVLSGKADGATWKRVITATLLIIAVVVMCFFPPAWGAIPLLIGQTLSILSLVMTLDSMYAGGVITGVAMSILDFIFNDVLNLDDTLGSDFNKFDKDHEDYQELVMYIKLSIAVAQMINAGYGMMTAPDPTSIIGAAAVGDTIAETSMAGVVGEFGTAGEAFAAGAAQNGVTSFAQASLPSATNAATSMFGGALKIGDTMANSSFLGVSATTYSGIYDAYSKAMSVKDVVTANEAYEKLKDKLEEDKSKLNDAIMSKIRKNFMKSYKDVAYFLQDQQEYIDRYVWGMTSQNMYVDPYGTTPVANMRFTPDKDTRVMSFGFEEMFDDSKMAGSKGYFNNILYG